jgi:hypothetical protein
MTEPPDPHRTSGPLDEELLIIAGGIGRVIDPDDWQLDAAGPLEVVEDSARIKAYLRMYLLQTDEIREIEYEAVTGLTLHRGEPNVNDRAYLNAVKIARLFASQGMDMREIGEMVNSALWALQYWRADNTPLFDKLREIQKITGRPE